MTMTILMSPGGAPGVTTTALALTLTWPRPVVLAECDQSGGAVLAGLWGGSRPAAGRGLLYLALDAQQNTPAEVAAAIWDHVLPLDEEGGRHVLPGVTDPAQSRQLAPVWPALAAGLAALDADVVADMGRFDCGPDQDPLFAAADSVVMILAPSVRQVAAARPRLACLKRHNVPVQLATVGKGPFGAEGPRLIADALATPLLAELPDDKPAACVLCDGAPPARSFTRSPLIRAAASAAKALTSEPAARRLAEVAR